MEVNGVTYPGLNPSLKNILAGRDAGGKGMSNAPVQQDQSVVEKAGQTAAKVKATEAARPLAELEKMVLKPREVSFEERMSQVISLEDIERILLVRSPYSMNETGAAKDMGQPGQRLDFKT